MISSHVRRWIAVLALAALLGILAFYPPWRLGAICFAIGAFLGGVLQFLAPARPEVPLEPIGPGWRTFWWLMVFTLVPALFVPIVRYFVPLMAVVILWGYAMYRYRVKRGVQT